MMVLAPRILIVDDEVHVRKLFVAVLAESGFDVTAAQSGRHALSLLSDAEFEIVILDMCLPDMDGLELIRRLHGDYPFLKITAVSGFMGGALQREAMSAGADATLSKPTTAMRLRNIVYALLDGVSVVAVQAVPGSEPEEPAMVLEDPNHGSQRNSVGSRERLKPDPGCEFLKASLIRESVGAGR